ncbi:catechol-2,3-dioxygenase [Robbsia andropogonis]|uniref:VOC family protein n=1 Tax=Robbsia andropogonis TaxID=28092 RepID=UPI0020A13D1E|nr:VOC family protein [Robbsia andropogonis]MCP1120482.1 VOC family protein [Robbsia andropogonis]MCP1130354.1 VOC family protein [Robbsia andropogonis]
MDLGHVGIHVRDFDAMLGFYQRVFGFVISDSKRGPERSIAFLTSEPDIHHQFVIASGRGADDHSRVINQISFRVSDLAELKRIGNALKHESVEEVDIITHGTAWSIYFRDPEGNRAEAFVDTPWYVDQPFRAPIDLDQPEEVLRRDTEALCRTLPGFQGIEAWRRDLIRRFESEKAAQ